MKFPASLVRHRYPSPLGPMILAASKIGLALAWFDDQDGLPELQDHGSGPTAPESSVLRHASRQLQEYFDGQRQLFDLPLDLSSGTAFQQCVWQALLKIPFGHTCCYADVAATIGKPSAVRAVGAAVGSNPLGIIVPCHRVIGADGSLTGYAGGLARKTLLLQLERGQDPQQGSLL